MGLDQRGIDRTRCNACDCEEYAFLEASPSQACGYCDHFPTCHRKRAPPPPPPPIYEASLTGIKSTLCTLSYVVSQVTAGVRDTVKLPFVIFRQIISWLSFITPFALMIAVLLPSRHFISDILDGTVSCPRLHQIILVLVLVLWLCSMFCVVLWTGFSVNITVIVSTPLVVGVFQIIVYWVDLWNSVGVTLLLKQLFNYVLLASLGIIGLVVDL